MNRGAFSLIELMVVVMIMGVVYTLSLSTLQRSNSGAANVTLSNLKEYMRSLKYEKSVKILCLDECRRCEILVDGTRRESMENFLDKSVKTYRYDFLQGAHEVSYEPFFNKDDREEKVCFSYTIDKNGVGEQVLVEYKNRVYDFSLFFAPTSSYASMQDALNAKEKLIQEVQK